MDAQSINIFLEALVNVLGEYGVENIVKKNIMKKEVMNVDMDITALIGLTGEIKGNVAYSFGIDTGKRLVSAMMMGTQINEIDSMGRSAIGEIANMITGRAGMLFSNTGKTFNVTPPSLVFGKNVVFVISSVDTIAVDLDTSFGKIQVNIGLEM